MTMAPSASAYQISNTLHLWYLGHPDQPVRVGELNLVQSGRGVSLRYAPEWLRTGFPLSEDLPLRDKEYLPKEKDTAAGAVDDARPDRWGERVIRHIDRPPRLSLMELLYFAGHERFGALGVSTSAAAYLPQQVYALPSLADVDQLHTQVRRVLGGEAIEEQYRRLIAPGATMGGARPKALLHLDGAEWVLKFAEEERSPEPLIEHATMTLAARAHISVAETRPIPLARGVAVAVRRFDRVAGHRLHALSANVALKAAGAELSYPNLALLLRRRGDTRDGYNQGQMREIFRRLVFNILMDNSDDHEKNHVLLMTDAQHLVLSPAFDLLPTCQALGYQAMVVGTAGAESSLENALSLCQAYGLNRPQALKEAQQVAEAVSHWRAHFEMSGVAAKDLETLAAFIDRPYLLEQRAALVR